MNATHIHLLLNHFPVIGTLIGSGLFLWGILKKHDNLKTAAAVILILMALIAIPVYLTGEPAEEAVENLPGISEAMMEEHEESATLAIWLLGLTGIVSMVSLVFYQQKKTVANTVFTVAFAMSIVSFGAMARTGYYGGKIRHTEIRNGTEANVQADEEKEGVDSTKSEKGESEEKEDDD